LAANNNRPAKARKRGAASRFFLGILRILGTILLIMLTTGLIFSCIFAAYVKNHLSSAMDIKPEDFSLNLTSVIYYTDKETGEYKELSLLYGKENREWVDYEEIPKWLEKAAVAIEDKRFYKHSGVDWYRTVAAFGNMFLGMRDTFGASTITQQLIKNLTQYDDVTVKRKLLEIFRALDFEKKYSKEQIMELYLNLIYLGRGCYGVASASNVYFGKELGELTLAECASLIGITNNPSLYDPYYFPENNIKRQKTILWEMYDQGYITKEQYEEAISQELVFQRGETEETIISDYSYFVDALIEDVINALKEAKNISYKAAEALLFSSGYKIYATIDPDVQAAIDEVYGDRENLPAGYVRSSTQELQSSIAVIDPFTGDIVGLAGGIGEKEGNRVYNRATMMLRPPGSTFKPLAVYSAGIELGKIMPYTTFNDSADVKLKGTSWYPYNDDFNNNGLVTVRYAVQRSLNTIAAQIIDMIGPSTAFDFVRDRFGITSMVGETDEQGFSDRDYAPMALGQLSYGASVVEMASAYTPFVNNGIYTRGRTYTHVTDSEGKLILENPLESHVAISELTAYYMTDLLTNVVNAGSGILAKLPDMPTAGKTGAAGNWTDRWFVGYTPYYVAAVWSGYDNPEYMGPSNPSASLWKMVMQKIHEDLEYKQFSRPEGMKLYTVCIDTGLLATEACAHDIRGNHTMTLYLQPSSAPTEQCNVHVMIDVCSESLGLISHNCPQDTHIRKSVLDLSKTQKSILTPPYKDEDDVLVPYILSEMKGCNFHVIDPATGWRVDRKTGYLVMPTGMLYDRKTGKVYDQYSGWEVDKKTGALIHPETGELIDPYTGKPYDGSWVNPITVPGGGTTPTPPHTSPSPSPTPSPTHTPSPRPTQTPEPSPPPRNEDPENSRLWFYSG